MWVYDRKLTEDEVHAILDGYLDEQPTDVNLVKIVHYRTFETVVIEGEELKQLQDKIERHCRKFFTKLEAEVESYDY